MSFFSRPSILTSLTLAALVLTGCGGAAATKEDDPSAKADPVETVKKVPETKLRALVGETAQAIDGGNAEVFTPKGWEASPGSVGFLISYKREKSAARLPRIYMKVDEVTAPMLSSEENNLAEFKTWANGYLPGKVSNFQHKIEPLKSMMIGDKACLRYVLKAADANNRPVENQVVQTLNAGKLYTVFLNVEDKDELVKYRDDAYAVMATMKFKGVGLPPAAEAAKPAEKK